MRNLMHFVLLVALVVCCIMPLVLDNHLSSQDANYTEAIAKYECLEERCVADFDGDGKPGNVLIDRVSEPPAISYPARRAWLVVIDSERELLRLPFNYADGTLRTHAAIRSAENGARLLIFDHTIEGTPIRQVFSWDGKQMVQVQPSLADEEILKALSARDDAGSWNNWALYRTLRIPVLIVYYIFLFVVVAAWIRIRQIRKSKVRSKFDASTAN